MSVIGLLANTENPQSLKSWCVSQLPLYDAVVCLNLSNHVANQIAPQFRNRLIGLGYESFDCLDLIDAAQQEIFKRFGHGYWVMLCNTNEYCYHAPAKVASLADRVGADAIGWYCVSRVDIAQKLATEKAETTLQSDVNHAQRDRSWPNSSLPLIEYRMYRECPELLPRLSTLTLQSPAEPGRKAPFHPILCRCNASAENFDEGDREANDVSDQITDQPWNLGEEFRPSATTYSRSAADDYQPSITTPTLASNYNPNGQRLLLDTIGVTAPQNRDFIPCSGLETHSMRVTANKFVSVPVLVRGAVDRSIIEEIWHRDTYGLRAMSHMNPATVIDVGAHIGIFSLFATELWPRTQVLACEADPENVQLLVGNTRRRRKIECIARAIIETDDNEITFHSVVDKQAFNSGGGSCARSEAGTRPIRVPAVPFAKLWRDRNITYCDLLKLDCEGSEVGLLSSLNRAGMLHRVGQIVGEWHAEDSEIESIRSVHCTLRGILEQTHIVTFAEAAMKREGLFVATPIQRAHGLG